MKKMIKECAGPLVTDLVETDKIDEGAKTVAVHKLSCNYHIDDQCSAKQRRRFKSLQES